MWCVLSECEPASVSASQALGPVSRNASELVLRNARSERMAFPLAVRPTPELALGCCSPPEEAGRVLQALAFDLGVTERGMRACMPQR